MGKMVGDTSGDTVFCELAQSKCMDMSQKQFCVEIYRENVGRDCRDNCFVRACAVKMHMDASHFFYANLRAK
jgi:hypothetical protein